MGLLRAGQWTYVPCWGGHRSRVGLDICPGCAGHMSRPAGSWGRSEGYSPVGYLRGKAEKQVIQRSRDSIQA